MVGALGRFPDHCVDLGIVACGGPEPDGIAAEGVEGTLRYDLARLVNTGSQVVEVARVVEIVEVDERRCRRIGAGEAERAAAALAQGAGTDAESALAAARPPAFEQDGKEVVLDVGMRGLWARAREGADLDLRRRAHAAPGQEPLGPDHEPCKQSGVAVARVEPALADPWFAGWDTMAPSTSDERRRALLDAIARKRHELEEFERQRDVAKRSLEHLTAELEALDSPKRGPSGPSACNPDALPLTGPEKVALFRSLFRGRGDVFPVLWTSTKTGRTGYSPGVQQ